GLLSRVRSFVLPLLDGAPARERLTSDLQRLDARADALRTDADALFTRLAVAATAQTPHAAWSGGYARRVRHRDMEGLIVRALPQLEVVIENHPALVDT